jgi:hypothetical protein
MVIYGGYLSTKDLLKDYLSTKDLFKDYLKTT